MIRWERTLQVKSTKVAPAIEYAKQVAEFCKKYKSLPPVRVYYDNFGVGPNIRWIVEYEDLAALEKAHIEVLADPGYHKAIQKVEDLFIMGTQEDVVLREI
jgi:hypothetical protein